MTTWRTRGLVTLVFLFLIGVLLATPAAAEPLPMPRVVGATAAPAPLAVEEYQIPPKVIVDAVLATRGENITLTNLSPDGKKFLITKTDGLPPISRLGCPCVHLAELAFDPVAGRARDLWVRSADGFDLFDYTTRKSVPVRIPAGARVSTPVWSPDGSQLAFFAHFEAATHIWIADTKTGASRPVTRTPVLATLTTGFQWCKDGKHIQTVLRPDDGADWEAKTAIAVGPKVRMAHGGPSPSRTYRYLLESVQDMRLFEHLITGQLAVVAVADGGVTKVGTPAMIRTVLPTADAKQFRVTTVKKPFSYYVPFERFGTLEGVWGSDGKSLVTLNERNLRENEPPQQAVTAGQPTGGVRAGTGGRKGAIGTSTDPMPPVDPMDPAPAPAPTVPAPGPDPDAQPRPGQPVDPDGKRDLTWRPDGAGLSFLQLEPAKAQAKADAKTTPKADAKAPAPKTAVAKEPEAKEPPRKDRVLLWSAPFGKDDAMVVYESTGRITAAQYSDDGGLLFVTQTVDNVRQITAIDLKDPKTTHVIFKAGSREPDAEPKKESEVDEDEQQPRKGGFGGRGGAGGPGGGPALLTRSRGGAGVVRISSGGDVYLSGTDRTRGGDGTFPKPYLDKVNIKTGTKTRIFEGKGDLLETIDAVDGDNVTKVFTTKQKTDVVPDSYVTELAGGKVTKLTNNVDRSPWNHEVKVNRFQVTRIDGFKFYVKVTTPPKATGKLPALFWIYPREYADQAAYNAAAGRGGQGGGPGGGGRFTTLNPRSMTLLTLLGYAVVEPDVPIVGPAGRMNDNYVPDLRNSLWAVIDDLDKKGIIDRDRLAVGGHSYGAFSTANALAHTPFFKAGIAGDGNYNRTLTSMTFQSERRQLWDARETYLEMSPILWANRVNGALLMYHGMEDANVGTDPINAHHLFMALDGLGKPAALYMYPYEDHGPISRETTLDLWARWVAWLDTYVKNPKTEKK
jgi:dipeptidyl aminopeptidase/acylaminoacyl peptidase